MEHVAVYPTCQPNSNCRGLPLANAPCTLAVQWSPRSTWWRVGGWRAAVQTAALPLGDLGGSHPGEHYRATDEREGVTCQRERACLYVCVHAVTSRKGVTSLKFDSLLLRFLPPSTPPSSLPFLPLFLLPILLFSSHPLIPPPTNPQSHLFGSSVRSTSLVPTKGMITTFSSPGRPADNMTMTKKQQTMWQSDEHGVWVWWNTVMY